MKPTKQPRFTDEFRFRNGPYKPALATDIRRTFARVLKQLQREQPAGQTKS